MSYFKLLSLKPGDLLKKLIFSVFILFFSVGKGWANNCELPKSLNGIKILFKLSTRYTPNNTMAGMLLQSKFDKETYVIEVLDTAAMFSGHYQYQRMLPNFARFNVEERSSENVVHYSKILICETHRTGFVIFKLIDELNQTNPVPSHDIGTYVIQSSSSKS